MMPKIILSLIITLSSISLGSSQDLSNLDQKYGFKDIKLMSNIRKYKGLEFKQEVDDEKVKTAQIYIPEKGAYNQIGNIKINELEVKAYNNLIFAIKVITEDDPNLYKGLVSLYGKPAYSVRSSNYYWSTDKTSLTFEAYKKNQLLLNFYAKEIEQVLKQEKKETVESIANDF
ncbi:MAG: hypothetical protein ACNS62_25245 [Candidatus Cyclobacteriaceae bacterium M3_2C_046]